jgi:hypothetical protein
MAGVPMTDDPSDQFSGEQLVRAREVLSDAGWLFDDIVNNEMRRVLVSQPNKERRPSPAHLKRMPTVKQGKAVSHAVFDRKLPLSPRSFRVSFGPRHPTRRAS